MHGGMTQSIIEVYEVSLGVRAPCKGDDDNAHPVVLWRTTGNKDCEGIMFLHELDIAVVKSTDGTVLHEWHGAKARSRKERVNSLRSEKPTWRTLSFSPIPANLSKTNQWG